MSTTSSIISFYRDCFEEENKGGGIANFLSAKVEHHQLIKDKEDHLSGMLPYTPISDKVGQKLQAEVALYPKEKELVYGAFFVLGKYENMQGKERRLIAPLLLYPCSIVYENELYFAEADLDNASFNPVIIELLKNNNPSFDEEAFFKQLPLGKINSASCGKLSRLMDQNLPNLDSSQMVDYPNNLSAYKINQLFKNHTFENTYQLIPASGIGLIRKSVRTRNAMAELNRMTDGKTTYSTPIQALFDNSASQELKFSNHSINPVAVLSEAQEQILKAATEHSLSIVVGPPGTGKSYTIANLAINSMSQGKSVLICSRNDGAVNVIEKQIESILGDKSMCVRGGGRNEIKALKDRLQFTLSRGSISQSHRHIKKKGVFFSIHEREKLMEDIRKRLNDYIAKFEASDLDELNDGELILKHDSSNKLWNRLIRFYISNKIHFRRKPPLWEITDLYLSLVEKMVSTTKEFVNTRYETRLHAAVAKNRSLLKNYLQSLRASNASRQKRFLESISMSELFEVFPIWLSNTKDVGELLPLKKELFDLVIIDEASQCDVATCLPLLQRAKRAVIVGDPKQLRHLSFLSRPKEYRLQQKQEFTEKDTEIYRHRDYSILDLVENRIQKQEQSNFLDEHYRSKSDIIRFSNQQFYFDQLKVMTNQLGKEEQSLFQVEVGGKRDEKGVNKKEVEQIIQRIKQIMATESELDQEYKQTIGILSPFRNQVDYIVESVQSNFTHQEIQEHQLLIGTSHSFQGEERDVMFLSFVLDSDSHASAFHFLNKEDVFNVSITRAKNKQYVFTSFQANQLPTDALVRRYIESIGRAENQTSALAEKDHFCNEVLDFLKQSSFQTHLAFNIAGISIDIAIEKDGKVYGLDLVGFPGPYEKTIELYKYKALLRVGIKMIPIPYTLWRFQREECEQKINELLKETKQNILGTTEDGRLKGVNPIK